MKIRMKKALCAAFIISLLSAVSARADVLYTACSNGYQNDRIGMIWGTNAPVKNVVTNLGGTMGSGVFPFKTASGSSRVAVSQYSGAEDVIWIYNPYNTTWASPLKEIGSSGNPIYNIRKMVSNGSYLYGIGYDKAQVARFNIGNSYANDKTFSSLNDGYSHGEGIVAYNGYIYGVFTYSKNAWDPAVGYSPNKLIKFDEDLNVITSMDLSSKNVDGGGVNGACLLHGNTLYIAAIGGYQHYDGVPNDDSMIEAVNLDSFTSKVLVRNKDIYEKFPEISKWIYDFRSVCITPSDDVYVQSGGWDYNNGNGCLIFKTTLSGLQSGDLGVILKKFSWNNAFIVFGMDYDKKTSCMYMTAAEGNSDYNGSLYRYDGTKWLDRYDMDALGGSIAAFGVLIKPSAVFNAEDVSVSSSAGEVLISSIAVSDDVPDLSGSVNGIDDAQAAYPGAALDISINHSKISDSASVIFSIKNFEGELTYGGSFKAFVKRQGENRYDVFDAEYSEDNKTLTFTIEPVSDYFAGQTTIVIGELTKKQSSGGSGGGGCNSGFAGILVITFIPVILYIGKNKR